MAVPFHVKVLEKCQISPPPSSVSSTSLPLTFLDIPWLFYPPNQTLLFFQKPPHFKSTTTISLLKKSLFHTLHHFHPLAGNLSVPPPPSKPQFTYSGGDSVSLTIAESNANSNHLSGNHPKNVDMLHSLVPKLQSPSVSAHTHVFLPLLAVQITFFRDLGFCIALAIQHVAADERTVDHFMKCWASICKSLVEKDSFLAFKSLPLFDRTVIVDQNSLETTFLKQWWNQAHSDSDLAVDHSNVDHSIVRATFILSLPDIIKIKNHILAKCKMKNEAPPVHLSPYVSACSLIWVCLLKAQAIEDDNFQRKPMYLGFNAGGITRLGFEVPKGYFGNCIAFGRCKATGSELAGEDGVVFAAKALGKEIKRLDGDVLGGAERWISEWEELNVRVLGSPKVGSYEMDFGWGKVDKVEKMVSSDFGDQNVISLTESKDLKGGMEIGVALSKDKMGIFTSLFDNCLKDLQ